MASVQSPAMFPLPARSWVSPRRASILSAFVSGLHVMGPAQGKCAVMLWGEADAVLAGSLGMSRRSHLDLLSFS